MKNGNHNWLGSLGHASRVAMVGGALALGFTVDNVQAGVQGASVQHGHVTIAQNGNHITITASDGSIINFQYFGVLPNEVIQFIQPHQFARVLNRITGPDPTVIQGTLLANGQVYIVNPAGVYFTNGSVVNVGGIYAAAGKLSDQRFLNGSDRFTQLSGPVVNEGMIDASSVALVGREVANHGIIRANGGGGMIAMVAGNDVYLRKHGERMTVKVDGSWLTPKRGPASGTTHPDQFASPGVQNTGEVNAVSGSILLAAGDMYALGIHNAGLISASGGEVHLAAADGLVHNSGRITAGVQDGHAGNVVVQGPSVLNEGRIDADAVSGSAGYVEVTSNDNTYLAAGSRISAAGLSGHAHGGEVLVHSYNGNTIMWDGATVDVSGGRVGGDGGFAEVSGRKHLNFMGKARLGARNAYERGTLLLDPRNIRIAQFGEPPVGVFEDGYYAFGEPGNIPFDDAVIGAGVLAAINGDIILEATGSIFVDWPVHLQHLNNVHMTANSTITFRESIFGANSITLLADADRDGQGWISMNVPLAVKDFLDFTAPHIFLQDRVSSGMGFLTSGGEQRFTGRVELERNYLLTGSKIIFNDTVDTKNSWSVLPNPEPPGFVNAGLKIQGDVEFNDPVGLARALAWLEVTGHTQINPANGPDITRALHGEGGGGGPMVIITDGNQNYLGDVFTATDVTFRSLLAGDINFQQRLDGFHDVLVETQGRTLFDGEVGGIEAPRSITTDAGGMTRINADMTADELHFMDNVKLLTDVELTAFLLAAFTGSVDGKGHSLRINSPLTRFFANMKNLDTLETDSVGLTEIDANISGRTIQLRDDVKLAGDSVVFGELLVNFDSTVDGAYHLEARSDDQVRFGNRVGLLERLASLLVEAKNLIVIDGSRVYVTGDIMLNPSGRSDVPFVATIASIGPLRLRSFAGSVVIGQNEKVTAIGDLNISALLDVILGDLNAFGDINISAGQIFIRSRPGGMVLRSDGTLVADDGVDIIATGTINASGLVTVLGNGKSPLIATRSGGGVSGTLTAFQQVSRSDLVRALFTFGNIVLDLAAQPSTPPPPPPPPSNDLALAFGESNNIETRVPRDPVYLRSAEQLALLLRGLTAQELVDSTSGAMLVMDVPQRVEMSPSDYSISAHRLSRQAILDASTAHDYVFYRDIVDPETGAVVAREDRGLYIRTVLARAFADYQSQPQDPEPPMSFGAYLLQTPDQREAMLYLRGLGSFFGALERMGATPLELRNCLNAVLGAVRPEEVEQSLLEHTIVEVHQRGTE